MPHAADATQQGVSDDLKPAKGQNIPHAADINEIAQMARQRRDEEMRENGIEPVDTRIQDEEEEQEEEITGQIDGDSPEGDEEQPPPPKMMKVIIDGVEQEIEESKILEAGQRAMQKQLTADARLEEATRLLREAEQHHAQTTNNPPPDKSGVDEKPPSVDAAKLAHALQYGTEEEAAEAIQQLAGIGREDFATQTQGMTPEQIAAYVDSAIKASTSFNLAAENFQKPADQGGYADIWGDQVLREIFMKREDEARAKGDNRPHWELYQEIGNDLRNWKQSLTGKPTKTTANLDKKREAKESIDTVPTAGGRSGGKPAGTPKPRTRAEVLADIAKARHQSF